MATLIKQNEKWIELHVKVILQRYGIENLMEYTLDSQIGCRLDILFKEVLEELLNTQVHVVGEEISEGKYRFKVFIGNYTYCMHSRSSFTKDDVADILMGFVILPHLNENGENR